MVNDYSKLFNENMSSFEAHHPLFCLNVYAFIIHKISVTGRTNARKYAL